MVSKLPEIPSPEDPTWLAEVTYRFAFDAAYRPLPSDANAARRRLDGGNRAFAELLDRAALSKPAKLRIDVDPRDVGLSHRQSAAPKQQPFAAVVGCADARVKRAFLIDLMRDCRVATGEVWIARPRRGQGMRPLSQRHGE